MKNQLQLHFQPDHYINYQEHNNSWRKSSWKELRTCRGVKRLQYNTTKYKNYIIIDIDHEKWDIYKTTNLPEPNLIVKNKNKNGCHYFYFLDKTVTHEYYKNIWKNVFKYFTRSFDGDVNNVGYIGKNIYNNIDFELIILNNNFYNILFLNSFVDDLNFINLKFENKSQQLDFSNFKFKDNNLEHIKEGSRNVELFNLIRIFSYSEVMKNLREEDFICNVKSYSINLNNDLVVPLSENELSHIIKSVTNYCLKNKNKIKSHKKKKKLDLDKNLDLKEKQKIAATYTAKIKSEKNKIRIETQVQYYQKNNIEYSIKSLARDLKMSKNTIKKYLNN